MTVSVACLDDVLPGGVSPSFIKTDVQATEHEVLEGAIETLRAHKPVVALEDTFGTTGYRHEPADIYDLLTTDAGLRIFDIDGGGPYDKASLREEVASLRRWLDFAREWD